GRNGLHRRPLRRILTAMLLHQSNSTLTDFRGKLVVLAHDCILSRNAASSKPGVIQYDLQALVLVGLYYLLVRLSCVSLGSVRNRLPQANLAVVWLMRWPASA